MFNGSTLVGVGIVGWIALLVILVREVALVAATSSAIAVLAPLVAAL